MPASPSPASYSPLGQLDDDETTTDPARARKGCPNEAIEWPEYHSSFLSRLFFYWFAPMERLGAATPLEHADLWSLHEKESTRRSLAEFQHFWDAEKARVAALSGDGGIKKEEPSLARAILNSCVGTVISGAILRVTVTISQLARPLALQQILKVVEDE
jgi:hypothetical protein